MQILLLFVISSVYALNNLEWWQTTIIYQIYPKSFHDSNADGYGDLRGIIEKLDYLYALGVKTLWLNPIYPSGGKDGGYDVTSFVDIDPLYGSMQDFDELIHKLHARGMYLVMDFIPNHTSDKHPWFIQSVQVNEKYRDYYVWKNGKNGKEEPNNWQSVFSNSSWEFSTQRNEWYLHQFLKDQPDLNVRSRDVQRELKEIVRFWLETKSVDGLRVDAMNFVFEDEELRDEPLLGGNLSHSSGNTYDSLNHTYTFGLAKNYEFVTELRELIDQISARVNRTKCFFIEAYDSTLNLINYYKFNEKLGAHFAFNFEFIKFYDESLSVYNTKRYHTSNITFTPANIRLLIDRWLLPNRPTYVWSNWQLGNHDNLRIASRLGRQYIDLANALVLLIGGTSVTYYGEEIGMEDLPFDVLTFDQVQDEYGKKFGRDEYHIYTRDYTRSPMQWSSLNNAEFSTSNYTWLPIHPQYKSLNVNEQLNRSMSHLSIYRELARVRQRNEFLHGTFEYFLINQEIFSFARKTNETTSLVVMNLSNRETHVNASEFAGIGEVIYYFNRKGYCKRYSPGVKLRTSFLRLDALSCLILSF